MGTQTNGLDGGPRGSSKELLSALGSAQKKRLFFFTDDDRAIGSHAVTDLLGEAQTVDAVQTWNRSNEMLLTSADKRQSVLVMDTERGVTTNELSLRRERRGWNMTVDSIAPMQKFDQYKSSKEIHLYGLGDNGRTVFHLHHDSRVQDNIEEHVVSADACRKYKSYVFTCQAQTKQGFLVLGRSDGAVSLYDYVMKKEDATCVISGQPGPVTAVDVTSDGSSLVWTTPDFVFFARLGDEHWVKGKKEKPRVMRLDVSEEDQERLGLLPAQPEAGTAGVEEEEEEDAEEDPLEWLPARFDAGTAGGAVNVEEREIISYLKHVQVRWTLKDLLVAYEREDGVVYGRAAPVDAHGSKVAFHKPVMDDLDVVALTGEVVKSLRF